MQDQRRGRRNENDALCGESHLNARELGDDESQKKGERANGMQTPPETRVALEELIQNQEGEVVAGTEERTRSPKP